ncbi:MAG: hypothetical protein AVDCRST_MAG66-1380, partial [uncultured Pseudonocardia sp.]
DGGAHGGEQDRLLPHLHPARPAGVRRGAAPAGVPGAPARRPGRGRGARRAPGARRLLLLRRQRGPAALRGGPHRAGRPLRGPGTGHCRPGGADRRRPRLLRRTAARPGRAGAGARRVGAGRGLRAPHRPARGRVGRGPGVRRPVAPARGRRGGRRHDRLHRWGRLRHRAHLRPAARPRRRVPAAPGRVRAAGVRLHAHRRAAGRARPGDRAPGHLPPAPLRRRRRAGGRRARRAGPRPRPHRPGVRRLVPRGLLREPAAGEGDL